MGQAAKGIYEDCWRRGSQVWCLLELTSMSMGISGYSGSSKIAIHGQAQMENTGSGNQPPAHCSSRFDT